MWSVCSLQVFPGDVGVPGGSGPWRWAGQSQNISSERGQSLCAELSVDEVQMCPDNQHGRVRGSSLQDTTRGVKINLFMCSLQRPLLDIQQGIFPQNKPVSCTSVRSWTTLITHLYVEQPCLQVGHGLLSQSQVPDHYIQSFISEETLVHCGHVGLSPDVPHVEHHRVLLRRTKRALRQE